MVAWWCRTACSTRGCAGTNAAALLASSTALACDAFEGRLAGDCPRARSEAASTTQQATRQVGGEGGGQASGAALASASVCASRPFRPLQQHGGSRETRRQRPGSMTKAGAFVTYVQQTRAFAWPPRWRAKCIDYSLDGSAGALSRRRSAHRMGLPAGGADRAAMSSSTAAEQAAAAGLAAPPPAD